MNNWKKCAAVVGAGLVMLLGACGGAPAGSAASAAETSAAPAARVEDVSGVEAENLAETVYRGRVAALQPGSVEVEQVAGHNYGYAMIMFHLEDDTEIFPQGTELAQDSFVEVRYSGVLTRGIPPQGVALAVNVIAPHSEGIVVNGAARTVEQTDEGWRIGLEPFAGDAPTAESAASFGLQAGTGAKGSETGDGTAVNGENLVILVVPGDALEGLSPEELVVGARLSAVTRGIAALSLPPQMPVVALLPYVE